MSVTTEPITTFADWEEQWRQEHKLQFPMDVQEDTSKRGVQETTSAVFMCDHCQEEGRGVPFELPDPTGEIGPQGSFCSRRCAKAVAVYEIGRDDVADLIDQFAGFTVEPAAAWARLETVVGEGGVTREDWDDEMTLDEDNLTPVEMPTVVDGTGRVKKNKK